MTEKEKHLLECILKSEYMDGDSPVNRSVWWFSVRHTLGTGAGGVMASLVKKGFAGISKATEPCGDGMSKRDSDTVWVTQLGFDELGKVQGPKFTPFDNTEAFVAVRKRAVEECGIADLLHFDMDMTAANADIPLDIEKLRDAPAFDFAHDIYGIQQHINRHTGKLDDFFVPRCALTQ